MSLGKKLLNIGLLTGLKRKIGKLVETLGAAGIIAPVISPDLALITDKKAVAVFALGVLVKYLGEFHAKLRGANNSQ